MIASTRNIFSRVPFRALSAAGHLCLQTSRQPTLVHQRPSATAKDGAAMAQPHLQLMIPGPVEFDGEVLAAAGGLAVSHVAPSFVAEFGEAIELLRKVFLCEHKGSQPFVVAGSGTLGWDMVAANLVQPGEPVLVLNTGYFGDRFAECLETYGAKVQHLRAPAVGGRPALAEVEAAVKAGLAGTPFRAVTITHVDTSTGVLMDIKSIAEIVRRVSPSTLVVVDGVCSVGAEELRMDDWGVDVTLTASQKALGVPPGLCIVVAAARAMEALEARTAPVANYYASWKRWLPIMQAYEARTPKYFATPPVQLVQALLVSCRQILAAGTMDDRFAAHVAVSEKVKDIVEKCWGLRTVPLCREGSAHSMTAIYYPEGLAPPQVLPKIMARGVMVAGGLLPDLATKYFRVGHMHISATKSELNHIALALKAVKEALAEAGHTFPPSAANDGL